MLIQNTSGGQNYSQWTWPKWVVPYRLRRFSHQFEHPKSTPYLSCKTFQRFKQGRAVSAATCSTTSAYSPAFSLAQRWQQSSAWGNYGIEHVQYVSTICGCPLAIDTINQIQKNKTLLDLLVVCQSWHHQKHNTSSVYFGISQKLLTRQPRLNRLNQVALVRSNLPVACSPKRSWESATPRGGAWRCVWEPIEVICW